MHCSSHTHGMWCFGCTGRISVLDTSAIDSMPAMVYMVVSYRNGVGSTTDGGATSIKRAIVTAFVSTSFDSSVLGAPNAFLNASSETCGGIDSDDITPITTTATASMSGKRRHCGDNTHNRT